MSELSCEAALAHLNSAIDGEALPAELEQAVADHLDDCVSCARAAREMSGVHRLMLEYEVQQADAPRSTDSGTIKPAARSARPSSKRITVRSLRRSDSNQTFGWWLAGAAAAAMVTLIFIASSGRSNNVADKKPKPQPGPSVQESQELAQKRRAAQDALAQADERRKNVMAQLAELDKKRESLATRPPVAPQVPPDTVSAEERERLAALANLDNTRREIEAELQRLQQARDVANDQLARVDEKRDEIQTPKVADVRPSPAPVTASQPLGRILVASDGARLQRDGALMRVSVGMALLPNDRILTGKGASNESRVEASLALNNGAAVDLSNTTTFEILNAKTSRLVAGQLYADVEKATSGSEYSGYRWVVNTKSGDVGITGTKFALIASETQTRLQMEEGTVDFSNANGKRRVSALQESVATPNGVPTAPTAIALNAIWRGRSDARFFPDEIVLGPAQAKITGDEWQYANDNRASTGNSLESPGNLSRAMRDITKYNSFLTFTLRAQANKDYYIWVRGCSMPSAEPIKQDAVILTIPDSTMVAPDGPNSKTQSRTDSELFNGFSNAKDFWWIGGDSDKFGNGSPDDTPVRVRFSKSGEQILRVYAVETPIRVDLIWISTTQKTRPEATQYGPLKR